MPKPEEPEMPTDEIINGTCGYNLAWSYNKTKAILTISGMGEMEDYFYTYSDLPPAPWFPYQEEIQAVVIEDGVTSIGNYAFYDCSALTQVTIPNSVTSIGYEAFSGCNGLATITIPNSVISIRSSAFYGTALYDNAGNWTNNVLYIDNCLIEAKTKLSGSYEIAVDTRVIAGEAFYGCSKLTQITIPNSVKSIGNYTFIDCDALIAIHVESGNPAYCSIDGILFNKEKTTLVRYPTGKPEMTYTIPDGVTNIGDGAFYQCYALTQATLPSSVKSIGSSAFLSCSALTQVNIPNSVTSIGDNAFLGCSALTQVNIPNSVTSIGDNAFLGCYALTQITIPNSVTSIGEWVFGYCNKLTQVTIGNSVESIGSLAFEYCSALAEMTVLPTVPPTVGSYAFDGVSRDIPVYVPAESLEAYKAVKGWKEFTNLQAIQ